jgi:hypothetical protein
VSLRFLLKTFVPAGPDDGSRAEDNGARNEDFQVGVATKSLPPVDQTSFF